MVTGHKGAPRGLFGLRPFEEVGKISLEALVKIAFVLRAEVEFGQLFPPQTPRTIDDVIYRPVRKRARKS